MEDEGDLPLPALTSLTSREKLNTRRFLEFYERHHLAIRSALRQSLLEAEPILGTDPPWLEGSPEQQALRHDCWEPYLGELDARAERFFAQGGAVGPWLRAAQALRESVLAQFSDDVALDRSELIAISLGMDRFIDLVTSGVAEATVKSVHGDAAMSLVDERFRLAFEAAPTGLVMVDAQGLIVFANAELERLFGYRREELIGKPIELVVPAAAREAHRKHRSAYGDLPTSRMMGAGRDLNGLRKDGSEFPVEIGLNPSRSRGQLSVLAVIADITERKRTQEALVTKMWELQRSNEDLEQFAYVASHDLQEPLRMVVSYTTLLSERYRARLDEKADKFIRYAVEGATRMQRLVADLLAYSRVGSQGKPLKPVSAQAIVARTIEGMRAAIDEAGAELRCGPLPTVSADDIQLAQLFQNLIGNALKFHADRPPRISIGAKSVDGKWLFSIEDNGIGIEKEHSERIFQMFQRLHERGKYEGSGIGLAIAKKIVERHRGRIWFESQPGIGSTFFFTMPTAPGGT